MKEPFDSDWDLDYVESRLGTLESRTEWEIQQPPNGYEMAASVLDYYNPDNIRALQLADIDVSVFRRDISEKEQLLSNSVVVYGSDGEPRLALNRERRMTCLRKLGPEGIRAALAVNTNPQTSLQKMLSSYARGDAAPVSEQSLPELIAALQVSDWLSGVVSSLPSHHDIQRRIDREGLLQPLRELADAHFVGRDRELSMLSDYVEFFEATSVYERASRGGRSLLGWNQKPPLVIQGIGGLGKSALAARFILMHLESADGRDNLPVVYLNFDRASVVKGKPINLIVECVRQLATQFDIVASQWQDLRQDWLKLATEREETAIVTVLHQFEELVTRAELRQRPFLIVMDTFEEADYRGEVYVDEVFHILTLLQKFIERLRVVIASRVEVTTKMVTVNNYRLPPLDAPDAIALLGLEGVADRADAEKIVGRFGGNPLTLRLAAAVFTKEGSLDFLETRDHRWIRLEDDIIQGQLYRRILGHIHTERVRRLAHPGLVLRKITAELILKVLAPACEIQVHSLEDARELLNELGREDSLVTADDDGSLHHRADLRAVTLRAQLFDEPTTARAIMERAVEFYAERATMPDKAEALYYMLLLERFPKELDNYWQPEFADYLRNAFDDLSETSQAWLAPRIGRELKGSSRNLADIETWELSALTSAKDALALGKPESALQILKQREERSEGSALYVLQAHAQMLLRPPDLEGARRALADGLESTRRPPDVPRFRVLSAWADSLDELRVPIGALPSELTRLARRYKDEPLVLRLGLYRLKYLRAYYSSDSLDAQRYATLLTELTLKFRDIAAMPRTLLRDLAIALGREKPDLLLFYVVRFGIIKVIPQLLSALQRWNAETGTLTGPNVQVSAADAAAELTIRGRLSGVPTYVAEAVISVISEDKSGSGIELYDELYPVNETRTVAHEAESDDGHIDSGSTADCDIVMKGGITSGVVYPAAVVELAKKYRFRNIGGTSAGAIAAALTAAAEYGRQKGTGTAFTARGLASIPQWLAGQGHLFELFRPNRATRPLFALLTRVLDSPQGQNKLLATFAAVFTWSWPVTILAAIPGLLFVLGGLAGGDNGAVAFGLALIFLIPLLISLGLLFDCLANKVPENLYGICTGLDDRDPSNATVLTNWLTATIDQLAGVENRSEPLTFGDLWGACGTADLTAASPLLDEQQTVYTIDEQRKARDVNLEMITTSLTLGRPYRFPFASNIFYFQPSEFRKLFPARVVDHMVAKPRPLTAKTEQDRADEAERRQWASSLGLAPWPAAADLPIVVAARMSLSFPLLISAVPLHAVDWSLPNNRQNGTHPEFERCWFSDGGLSSNFPIHLFDGPIPMRPTFGIDLDAFPPDSEDQRDQSANVWMPMSNADGTLPTWTRFGEKRPDLGGFVGAILNAMQNWQDNMQSRVPGFRDRIVHVYLNADEGGMNLNMSQQLLTKLAARGTCAGRRLIENFSEPNPEVCGGAVGRHQPTNWDNHRVVRYRTAMALLENWIRRFCGAYSGDYKALTSRPLDAPPCSYRWHDEGQRSYAATATAELLDMDARWKATGETFDDGTPRPSPELAVRLDM
jgi:hypothetical protein